MKLLRAGGAVDKDERRPIIISVLVFVMALGALTRSNALSTVRAVDALLLFAVGMSAGVTLARVLVLRKP